MLLDQEIREQLFEYLTLLEQSIVLEANLGTDSVSKDIKELMDELQKGSDQILIQMNETTDSTPSMRTPSFTIKKEGDVARVCFAGLPLGHEFTSLVLALLQVSGRTPKISPDLIQAIKGIQGSYHFETYISLSCHNCPDVVQALNTMSVLNPNISHTMIDGGAFKEEIEEKGIMAVPAVFLNGEMFGSGRMTLEDILAKLTSDNNLSRDIIEETYDVLVIGGGPAGAAAAIYAARKGLKTAIVAERFGGQVLETVGIENLIGTSYTEGSKLARSLEEHVMTYPVTLLKGHRAITLRKEDINIITLENKQELKSKTVILSTGARWRNTGVKGEAELKTKGVCYCPHCDGPLFEGKDVAVIGGGNSGIEAAIDLANITKNVTVLEFMPELKADAVLQKKLYSLPNVTVYKNVQTKEMLGTEKVSGISFENRETGEVKTISLDGIFVQIGLVANTEWLKDTLELSRTGEIIVDAKGATNIPGVFAAGDCTNSPYKQIIISMGSGATAALSAFDYLIRN